MPIRGEGDERGRNATFCQTPRVSPDALLELFDEVADAIRRALSGVTGADRRAGTERPGQYVADLVADAAALEVLGRAPVGIVSEESGRSGPSAEVTVVLDPIDGSTNYSRGIPYWATSLSALDGEGLLASTVVNHATGTTVRATRGGGTTRDGDVVVPATVRGLEGALVAYNGMPEGRAAWHQYRSLGSGALALCDVACGVLDAFADSAAHHAPWDYLGGVHACLEAGAVVADTEGRVLVTADPDVRRQVVAAGTPDLLAAATAVVRA